MLSDVTAWKPADDYCSCWIVKTPETVKDKVVEPASKTGRLTLFEAEAFMSMVRVL